MIYRNWSFAFFFFLIELMKNAFVAGNCPNVQHFDGPSFVGGIVLAVGVVAIGYVLWRYFQSKRQTGMSFNDI